MPEDFIVQVSGDFDAAHMLPTYQGKCARLHGHRWEYLISLHFYGIEISECPGGMLIDFNLVKAVAEQYDHQCLNDYFSDPTCEMVARSLLNQVSAIAESEHLGFVQVTLSEGPRSSITVSTSFERELELVRELEAICE